MMKSTLSYSCLLGGFLLGASALAGSFTSDFSNPAQTGFTLTGGSRPSGDPYPVIANGYLALTFAENGEQGTILLDDLDPGKTVGAFKASFKTRIGGGTSTPADGMAFHFGTAPLEGATFGEEGPTDATGVPLPDLGITVCIDTYDNVDADPANGVGEAPAIDVRVNGVMVAHTMVDVFFPLSDTFVPMNIQLSASGLLNVDFKGTVIYTNLVLTGYTPTAGSRFAIGARTGGANENNWVDDLSVTTTEAPPPAGPGVADQPKSQTINEYASVTFSVLPTGTPPFQFLWTSDKTTLTGETNATLTLNNVSANLNGAKFHVKITNPLGNVTSDDAVLTVNSDTVAPTVTSAVGSDTFDTVTVTFSEPVTTAGATFAINNGLSISSTTQPSPTKAVLKTSAQTPGTVYTITINGVKDLASVANSIAADTKVNFSSFVISPGFLKFEVWNGLSTTDNSLDTTLLADPRFPAAPDLVAFTTPFTTRTVYPDDTHEGYGGKMSGWLNPTESGDYRFFLYSDDSSRLFLSTDATAANAVLVAEEVACCNPFTEPGTARTSEPISLVAGKRYYVEALWKEGTGGDYCLVGWRKEGDTTPPAQLPTIPGQYLSTYADPGPAIINITQQPASAETTENKSVTFTVAANGTPAPLLYQWQRANPGSSTFANIQGATTASYTTPLLKKALDNGAKYQALVSVPGKALPSAEATLTVDIDNIPPSVVRTVAGVDLHSVYLFFSEPMDAASAGDFKNYSVAGLTVTGAKVLDAQRVMVFTSLQAEDTGYTVTVGSGVTDTAIPANPIDATANSGSFTSPVVLPATMTWQIYTGLSTATAVVSDLTSDPRYPTDPSVVKLTPGYEGPGFGDGYGARIYGFITPKTTGNYVFYMSSDDNGELWLSTDDSAANAVRIAREPVWGNLREWTGGGQGGTGTARCEAGPCLNISDPIPLVAGRRYYTELLWKEGGGGDHGEAAWKLESAADPVNGSTPIWGDVLSTAVPKALPATISLSADIASPIGSADASKPGFNVRIYQADQDGGTVSVNQTSRAEQELAGLLGPNVADLSAAVGGIFAIDSVVNWDQGGADAGTMLGDGPIPGIPGLGVNTARNTDNIAAEIITYAEFPKAGAYMMGVTSDDGFKLTATDKAPANIRAVRVHAPSTAAGSYYAADSATTYGGIFKIFTTPISGKLVLADPPEACSDTLNNAAAIKGNIALVYRGVCTFTSKCQKALDAGAIAAIVVNSRDPGSADGPWPIIMGGSYVDIPAVMMTKPDGNKIRAALQAGENITVDLTPDETPALGEIDGGASSAFFTLYVAQAGVYPLRMVWFEGEGGANVEWFSFDSTGVQALVNDRSNPNAIKTYRARTFTPVVTPEITSIKLDGANVTITFKGVLQGADQVNGSYSDVSGASSPTYTTSVAGKTAKFFRARR